MKTLKLSRPVFEASLSKYSVIQKLNMVIAIFTDIFQGSNPDDLNQISIFTAQYASFRLSTLINPKLSTYVNLLPAATATAASTSAHQHISTSTHPCIIEPVFYTIPLLLIHHIIISRKMLIESLPALSTVEKLNLILAIYDNICLNENDLHKLNNIMSGYVRFALKHRSKRSRAEGGGLRL